MPSDLSDWGRFTSDLNNVSKKRIDVQFVIIHLLYPESETLCFYIDYYIFLMFYGFNTVSDDIGFSLFNNHFLNIVK